MSRRYSLANTSLEVVTFHDSDDEPEPISQELNDKGCGEETTSDGEGVCTRF